MNDYANVIENEYYSLLTIIKRWNYGQFVRLIKI